MRDARLLEGGRHHPDLAVGAGERRGDLLGDLEAGRADAVVVGDQNAHARPPVSAALSRHAPAPVQPTAVRSGRRARGRRGSRGPRPVVSVATPSVWRAISGVSVSQGRTSMRAPMPTEPRSSRVVAVALGRPVEGLAVVDEGVELGRLDRAAERRAGELAAELDPARPSRCRRWCCPARSRGRFGAAEGEALGVRQHVGGELAGRFDVERPGAGAEALQPGEREARGGEVGHARRRPLGADLRAEGVEALAEPASSRVTPPKRSATSQVRPGVEHSEPVGAGLSPPAKPVTLSALCHSMPARPVRFCERVRTKGTIRPAARLVAFEVTVRSSGEPLRGRSGSPREMLPRSSSRRAVEQRAGRGRQRHVGDAWPKASEVLLRRHRDEPVDPLVAAEEVVGAGAGRSCVAGP